MKQHEQASGTLERYTSSWCGQRPEQAGLRASVLAAVLTAALEQNAGRKRVKEGQGFLYLTV